MNKRKLRVAWCSNHPEASSGYSMQTADMVKQFLANGWDSSNFALINMFGMGGFKYRDKNDVMNYPVLNHNMGSDAMVHHGNHFKADMVISLLDVWAQNPEDMRNVRRWVPWTPVDYDPAPKAITNILRFANRIISMSKFGQRALMEQGFASTYIPHHVDTKIFYPMDKKQRKIDVKIDPSMFVIGMVAANKDLTTRKSFGQILEAFGMFVTNHPEARMYIHTGPEMPGAYPIRSHADYLGISQYIAFPDTYKWQIDTTKEEMNHIFNTFDLYLMPSSTEGFGITAIEAQATGTPVIVNDYTSMPELVQNERTGWITKIGCQHFLPIGGYQKYPNVNDLYEKMELAYRSNREVIGKNARKWIMQNYDMGLIWKTKWQPFLDRIEAEVYPQQQPLTQQSASI